jgi:hypothetical protein
MGNSVLKERAATMFRAEVPVSLHFGVLNYAYGQLYNICRVMFLVVMCINQMLKPRLMYMLTGTCVFETRCELPI